MRLNNIENCSIALEIVRNWGFVLSLGALYCLLGPGGWGGANREGHRRRRRGAEGRGVAARRGVRGGELNWMGIHEITRQSPNRQYKNPTC